MNVLTDQQATEARERLADDCRGMKRLLEGLFDSQGRIADEVHAVRKLGKSLRGGFSLFRLGKSASLEIQAIGRLLSGPRDAISRFHTWTNLGWSEDPKVAAAIAGLLEQATHSAARRPPRETVDWCHDRVDTALAKLDNLKADGLGERACEGFRKLEKRAVKRCRRLNDRDPASFHEARKALKAWLGAVGFLPEEMRPDRPEHKVLAELLGDENDLATLAAWLEDHGFTTRFAPGLWEHLVRSRDHHQRTAIRYGAAL